MTDRQKADKAIKALKALLEWEREMGGWEARCWEEAKRFVKKCSEDEE